MVLRLLYFRIAWKTCPNTDWCLPPPQRVSDSYGLKWGARICVSKKFPGDADSVLNSVWIYFERTIVLGRSSCICKSRELKTWCIQKTLSMGLAWGPVVKTPHLHCPRQGFYPWSKNWESSCLWCSQKNPKRQSK